MGSAIITPVPPNGGNPYQVYGVTIRQAARLDSTAQPYNATILTFYVGRHGPFTVEFAPAMATEANVLQVITATVNQLRAQDSAITTLNQQM